MTTWEAPRIAYEIMRDWTRRRAEAAGGGYPLPGKLWQDLRPDQRGDVLTALGGQARCALELGRAHGWMDWDSPLREYMTLSAPLCQLARDQLEALLRGEDWTPPDCGHCAEAGALLLCAVTHAVYRALGFQTAQILADAS